MANAVRNKQPAFVEALQCISDLPLNPRKALAIGRVETLVDHHGADDIGRVDRRPRPTKRVEHAPRQFSMLEPKIGLPDFFAGIVFGSNPGANKRSVASR